MTLQTFATDGTRHGAPAPGARGGTGPGTRARVAAIAAALLGGMAYGAVPALAVTVVEPTYIPAGVSDTAGTLGCVRTPQGGVDAVDLKSGRSIWHSSAAAWPLLVTGGRAFLLEEGGKEPLRLAIHGAQDGRLLKSYDLTSLALPPWASLTGRRQGREWTEFEARGRLMGDKLELHYKVTRRQVSGMAAPGVVGQADGVALVAMDSGRVVVPIGPPSPPPAVSETAPAMPGVRLVSVHARAADARIVLGGPPPNVGSAVILGDLRMAFELSQDARTVTVHRWSIAGGSRDSVLRIDHGQPTDAVWVTLDRGHVLLRRASDQQFYDLYSLQSGKPEGKLERPADVAVVGQRVYWTTLDPKGRLALAAANLESGNRLWRRAVRDAEGPPGEPIP